MRSKEIAEGLKSHAFPWEGGVIFACRRCQKRLRKSDAAGGFAKIKKWLKKRSRRDQSAAAHVIAIPCQDICPKRGIVVCGPEQLAARPAQFCIISSEEQMEAFYRNFVKRIHP